MKLVVLLTIMLSFLMAFDSPISSVSLKKAESRYVVINGERFISGSTYLFEFLPKKQKQALQKAVANSNPIIEKVTFSK